MKVRKYAISLLVLGLGINTAVYAQNENAEQTKNYGIFLPKDIKWSSGPDSLPKGAEIAVLEGDPTQSGPFTIRLKFPANYKVSPHYHPSAEHVTVISGNFYLGMGDTFETKNVKTLPAGSFMFMEPEMHHYALTRGPTVIQLHGVGPWGITYLDSKDDPRNKNNTQDEMTQKR